MAQARYCPRCPNWTHSPLDTKGFWSGVNLRRTGQGRTADGHRGWVYSCPRCGWIGLRRKDRWLDRGPQSPGRPKGSVKSAHFDRESGSNAEKKS
jgi:hypothetical protein